MKKALSQSNRFQVFLDGQANTQSDQGDIIEKELHDMLYLTSINTTDWRERYQWLFAICGLIKGGSK